MVSCVCMETLGLPEPCASKKSSCRFQGNFAGASPTPTGCLHPPSPKQEGRCLPGLAGDRGVKNREQRRARFWRLTVPLRCAGVLTEGAAPQDCGDPLSMLTMSEPEGADGEGCLPGGATTPGPREQGSPDPGANPCQRGTRQAAGAIPDAHSTSESVPRRQTALGRFVLTLPGCVSSGKF